MPPAKLDVCYRILLLLFCVDVYLVPWQLDTVDLQEYTTNPLTITEWREWANQNGTNPPINSSESFDIKNCHLFLTMGFFQWNI